MPKAPLEAVIAEQVVIRATAEPEKAIAFRSGMIVIGG